jgi:hypothetical protein
MRPRRSTVKHIRIVLVSLVVVFFFAGTSCGGGGCGSRNQPASPEKPAP